MYLNAHINTALHIIKQYDGQLPLAHYLKQYFAANKKHGSKDRKNISHLCYCWYRLGRALKEVESSERIKVALFLCTEELKSWASLFDNDWPVPRPLSLIEKIDFIRQQFPSLNSDDIFQFSDHLSEGINKQQFCLSHLIQPDLFIRIRPGYENKVMSVLDQQSISNIRIDKNCIALPNATKIETLFDINREIVVQDYSSQRISEFLQIIPENKQPVKVWDCCAASGGKSLLAKDTLSASDLTVSDIRPSIIHNLKQRFSEAGLKHYHSFVADISKPLNVSLQFDLIICDAPCSGSGTWGRTPEQLYFFREEKINEYASLQKKIVNNAIPHLVDNGYFLYITCSVFDKENEDVVKYITQNFNVEIIKTEALKGYDKKADTMFAALFKKVV